ncbi:DUF677 domain-containing protein [Flavobacterium sp. CBA20B-1]|uniref:DUF677 domain-containing protein n=1 Tax=unclassified Flavobacterium TaxID=196869 RepID=UPI00222539B0|nr:MULTISPECIES: DUF677 domain-containing protein [unclassified Flavobacterium]WCM43285.1 DUF677 domain-containing protein [Flavobacterium sp. CBA20B-1]
MKTKILKLLAAGSLTAVLSYGAYIYACAGGEWGAGYTSLFSPEITVNNKEYEPFFYDDYFIFYYGYNVQSTTDLFKAENVADWTNYLKKYSPETVEYFLYDESLDAPLRTISQSKNAEVEFKKQNFKFTLDTSDEKTQKFVLFIMLARGIETYSNQTYNYWDYDNRKQLNADSDFTTKVENLYKKDVTQKDEFFKNRMWFQVVRSKFYSADRGSVIPFFNESQNEQPKNNLYYQAMNYVGGAYKNLKNYEKANATFAQVFHQCKPLMASALFDYKPLDETAFKASLSQASDQNTKETLYALQGYYTNEFSAMQDLYKLNPNSPHIDFLLSRWVNINEQNINTYTAYEKLDIDAGKIKKELKDKVSAAEVKWINDVASDAKVHNPYIWKTTAAYFNSLIGDYSKADKLLKEAHTLSQNANQKNQVRSLRLFNNLLSTDEMNQKAEGKLIEDVNWLFYEDKFPVKDYVTEGRIDYLNSFTKKYISSLYKKQGNGLMSELTYSIKGFYKDQKQSIAMEKLLLSSERSAWQDLFVGVYPYKLADIYESRGIYLFYQDKIDEAIAEFEKITPFESKTYNWQKDKYETEMVDYKKAQLPGNPFNGKIKDCNDCDHAAKQSVKYSQLDFLYKVKEMKEKIAAGEDVYNNALLVGNAFYNTSYFGNARFFYYNNIIDEYGNSISNEHSKMLYSMENVRKYYNIAQKAATDNEQKAKMAYMLAKTQRNDFYYNKYFSTRSYWGYPDGPVIQKWQGFVDLKTNYSDTKYYQDVIAECGYFRKYLGLQ